MTTRHATAAVRERRLAVPCRGAALLEMAVAMIPCLLIVMAIMEYGRYEMARQLVLQAARAGARVAVNSKRSASTASIGSIVTQQLAGQVPGDVAVAIYRTDATGANLGDWTSANVGDWVATSITATYSPLVPTLGILHPTMPLRGTAVMRCEVN